MSKPQSPAYADSHDLFIEQDLKVGFILSPQFTLIAFASFIDCLRHAADEADYSRQIFCKWRVIAPKIEPVTSSCGVELLPQAQFPDPKTFTYIVVVGGLIPDCLNLCEQTYRFLSSARLQHVPIVGLCTGSFILARAGFLEGRHCAVHFEHRKQFAEMFPAAYPVTDKSFINADNVITCPGGIAPLDLAFALIEEHCGKARAVKGITSLLVNHHPVTHHGFLRPYDNLTYCGNWRVEQAVHLMQRHISAPFRINQLASRLDTSTRELNRAFKQYAGETPLQIWRKIRLAHGHWLLLNSARNITQIAMECGFADAAHFSRWFKQQYRERPSVFRQYRRKV